MLWSLSDTAGGQLRAAPPVARRPVALFNGPRLIGDRPMTEAMQTIIDLLTAAAALGAFAVGAWNAYQFGKLTARVDTLETAHNAHVNAPALHR